MSEDNIKLTQQQARLAASIQHIDKRIAQIDDDNLQLIAAGMKIPTPLGAGVYIRQENKNDALKKDLLSERAGLVAELKKLMPGES